MTLQDLAARCNTVEECYEFMLAYAAQGLTRDSGSGSGEQLRRLLTRAIDALTGLPGAYKSIISQAALQPSAKHEAFLAVLTGDCTDALAALELVLSQPVISSQLVDNLNASMHLRALLTDLFLLDEIAKLQSNQQALSADR